VKDLLFHGYFSLPGWQSQMRQTFGAAIRQRVRSDPASSRRWAIGAYGLFMDAPPHVLTAPGDLDPVVFFCSCRRCGIQPTAFIGSPSPEAVLQWILHAPACSVSAPVSKELTRPASAPDIPRCWPVKLIPT
jgi:hypothetical protein